MGRKKVKIIRDWIRNYIQSGIVNALMKHFKVPPAISNAINLAMNLDQLSIVQSAISQLGTWKYISYAVWFLLFA